MLNFTINCRLYQAEVGEKLIDALKKAGIYIPHICYREGLSLVESCDMCLVEVNGRLSRSCSIIEGKKEFIKLLNLLHESGIPPFLVGFMEKFHENVAFLTEQNAALIRNSNKLYSILNRESKVKEKVTLHDIIRMHDYLDIKRGIYMFLHFMKVIGSASKENKPKESEG